jgi:DNA-binding transcriptional ArsR family regulator
VIEAGRRIEERGVYGLLRGLWPEVRCDAEDGRFWLERPHEHDTLARAGVTEAAMSKHLRVLAEAGRLERRRDGYYVLYRLVPEQLAAVAPSLNAFLDTSKREN